MSDTYTVDMTATVRGSITVEADSGDEALLIATESGMELADISEVSDAVAVRAEFFQEGSL